MPPPNSVVIASPLPAHYFGGAYGNMVSAPAGQNIIGEPTILPGLRSDEPLVSLPVSREHVQPAFHDAGLQLSHAGRWLYDRWTELRDRFGGS